MSKTAGLAHNGWQRHFVPFLFVGTERAGAWAGKTAHDRVGRIMRHISIPTLSLILVLCGPALLVHAQDEVERLLLGESAAGAEPWRLTDSATTTEPKAADTSGTDDDWLDNHAPTLPGQSWTRPAKKPVAVAAPADAAAAKSDEPKSEPASRVDQVPEPSALAMGAVALLFFLLLGRRRRIG